jgi:hypothetical protein
VKPRCARLGHPKNLVMVSPVARSVWLVDRDLSFQSGAEHASRRLTSSVPHVACLRERLMVPDKESETESPRPFLIAVHAIYLVRRRMMRCASCESMMCSVLLPD